MKKLTLLVTVAGLLLTNMLMGQVAINQDGSDADANSVLDVKNSSGTNVFYIEDASGEVGVGTTSPGALLDVAGTSEFNGTMNLTNHNITHVNYLKINDIGDQEGIIWSGSAAKIFVSPLNSGNSDGYLRLINDGGIVFEPGAEDDEVMTLHSNGNVGIGTTTPSFPLDVTDNSSARVGSFMSMETSSDNYAVYGNCSQTDWYGYGGYFVGGFVGIQAVVNPTGSHSYYGVRSEVSGGTGTNYGVYGLVNGAESFGGRFHNTTNTGTGILGSGTGSGGIYLTSGSGGAFVGDSIGLVSWGINENEGTGVMGSGNNIGSPFYLTGGSGGAFTGETIGVYGKATTTAVDAWGGYFENDGAYAYVGGWDNSGTARKIVGNGTVNTIVESTRGDLITLTCPEAPEVLFQDYGIGELVNGKAHITLDPDLTKNIHVDKEHPMKVFVTLEGDCNGVYVTNKSANGFDVIELKGGASNVPFSWQIVATRANEEIVLKDGSVRVSDYSQRFQSAPGPKESKKQASKKLQERTEKK